MNEFKKVPFINPSNLTQFSLRAAVIIEIDQKFVLVKNEGKDKYKLPGGHLNVNESFADGLRRELKEELGIDLNVPSSPDFFDQLVVNDLMVITAYFNIENINLTQEQLLQKSKLPIEFFSIDELSEQITFASEIAVIKIL